MAYRFTAADRVAFKRCRRQWDFAARERQNLEPFRRTRILRDPAELAAMGARLRLYPNPAPGHCGGCRFVAPCLAMERGDLRAVLAAGYRDRGPERVEPGRLGSATWGTGRGAAPPRFGPG